MGLTMAHQCRHEIRTVTIALCVSERDGRPAYDRFEYCAVCAETFLTAIEAGTAHLHREKRTFIGPSVASAHSAEAKRRRQDAIHAALRLVD